MSGQAPGRALHEIRAWRLERWLLVLMGLAIFTLSALLLLPNTRGEKAQVQDRTEIAEAVRQCRSRTLQSLVGQQPPSISILGIVSSQCYEEVRRDGILGEFAIRRAAFSEQAYQGRIILWMVVVITISGVGLAGLQLLLGFRLAGLGKGQQASEGEVTLERGKIAVRSSVTGLLILAVSFAFFLVYVLWIYTIEEASPLGRTGSREDRLDQQFGTVAQPAPAQLTAPQVAPKQPSQRAGAQAPQR